MALRLPTMLHVRLDPASRKCTARNGGKDSSTSHVLFFLLRLTFCCIEGKFQVSLLVISGVSCISRCWYSAYDEQLQTQAFASSPRDGEWNKTKSRLVPASTIAKRAPRSGQGAHRLTRLDLKHRIGLILVVSSRVLMQDS